MNFSSVTKKTIFFLFLFSSVFTVKQSFGGILQQHLLAGDGDAASQPKTLLINNGAVQIVTPYKGSQEITIINRSGAELGTYSLLAHKGYVQLPVHTDGTPTMYTIRIKATDGKMISRNILVL